MPSYQVVNKGFHGGKTYDPNGKRRVLHVEKAFKKVPSWLKPIEQETKAQASARKGAETKAANAAKKKAEQDAADIKGASFLAGDDKSTVETL